MQQKVPKVGIFARKTFTLVKKNLSWGEIKQRAYFLQIWHGLETINKCSYCPRREAWIDFDWLLHLVLHLPGGETWSLLWMVASHTLRRTWSLCWLVASQTWRRTWVCLTSCFTLLEENLKFALTCCFTHIEENLKFCSDRLLHIHEGEPELCSDWLLHISGGEPEVYSELLLGGEPVLCTDLLPSHLLKWGPGIRSACLLPLPGEKPGVWSYWLLHILYST